MTESVEPAAHVVVIGGGYAGAVAANRLCSRPDVRVTLVNPRPSFVERIRLHQLVADNDDAAIDYASLLNPAVRLVVDRVRQIDAAAQRISLDSGTTMAYDYVIYAVGSTSAVPAVPGAAQYALPAAEFEDAQRLRARVAELAPQASIVVVGGGLTGIEFAAELAQNRQAGTVTLVGGEMIGAGLSNSARRSVIRQLDKLSVRAIEGAAVTKVSADAVTLADGRELRSAVTVWTAGFGVPDLAARSGLRTDAMGRLLTDETLTSVDDARIVAAGDAAAPSGHPLRMSCQAAMPLGAQAADTVLSRIAVRKPAAINQAFSMWCISLGRTRGTIGFTHADDSPRRPRVSGRPAAAFKEMICKSTVRSIARESRKPGSLFWFRRGPRPASPSSMPNSVPAA
ncbi:MAG: NAD(P)/FAD-dependent oxidoreductase [Mycobacterium sp.]